MDVTDLIARYDRRVPRYTSYPTAPHFTPAVNGETYHGWLSAIPDGTALSLYIHVPFCASMCLFCACHTTVVRKVEPVIAYADTLLTEIGLVAEAIGRRMPVRHVHWGGGTPTAMPPAQMLAVMARLREVFDFLPDAEVAVEIDPRTLTPESVEGLARMGTTRVSLGVQDFQESVQQAINRHQSLAVTANCARMLREAGITALNLDLIYGLPRQTVDSVIATADAAMGLDPDRVAVFGYAHVPWMKKHQSLLPEADLPKTLQRFAQREAMEKTILSHGLVALGLDHYAKPGDALAVAALDNRMKRNFQGYTTDEAPVLLGFGASSIGSLGQGYVQNLPQIPAWRDTVKAGRLPIARGVALTDEDRLRRHVIEEIMCQFTVDLRAIAAAHRTDPAGLMAAAPALQEMARDGLIEWDGYRIAVTEHGRPFVRGVAAAFDTYLAPGEARHSAAV